MNIHKLNYAVKERTYLKSAAEIFKRSPTKYYLKRVKHYA